MPRINVSPAMMAEVKEVMTSTSEKILRLSQGNRLADATVVQELCDVLRTATERVANLLSGGTPTDQLPPELLTRIFDLTVDRGSEEYTKQIIHLTHVCRYWRSTLLSYPRIWSTVCMKPGDPSVISEWLARSQRAPLTVIAEFSDFYEHPPCRYEDEATSTLADNYDDEVCPRHRAALSLDRLLPHRSRIRDLSILLHSSDPYWDEEDHEGGEPTLLSHHFFMKPLPNLQRLDFRAAHVEQTRYMIPIPESLFGGYLPRLKDLKYLGAARGLAGTVKGLTSCEIGSWSESAGPAIIYPDELQVFLNNNKTLKSLTINECEYMADGSWEPGATPMTDLEFLKIVCFFGSEFEKIISFIHAPQLKDLDTVHVSLPSTIQVVATSSSGHTFQFIRFNEDNSNFNPLRYLEAVITTLRLDREINTMKAADEEALHELFRSLDTVQVLEFHGTVAEYVQDALSTPGVFPGLKVIRVAVSRDDCREALQSLAIASRRRMDGGNPLAMIEPLLAEGEDGLDQSVSVEWEESYKAEDIQNLLSR